MDVPRIVLDIMDSFETYVKTNDKSVIEKYALEDLKTASAFSFYENDPWWKLVMNRIQELESKENQRRSTREKWIDRIIGFASGVFVSVVSLWIKKLITGHW